ncbi:HAD hydrolase-like protein [Shewanella sp. JM162201]|uniref:HAD hydrolase-like protein n=1 Tax=Shewanella jiangmenensis TaxID=2837387 RepID=A0ABS5V4W3_9GAMM|nr:HAD hydrolase-like protein [Shewanella jiangmenensis]
MSGVLFDLDGTLVDTAPDLVAALNLSLHEHGFAKVSLAQMRHVASHGSMALVRAGAPGITDAEALMLQQALLRHYHQVNGNHATLFDGVAALLDGLAAKGIPWGIVTNKAARYARPLINKLGLTSARTVSRANKGNYFCQSLISGDSVTRGKPDAAPLLLAASQIGCMPSRIFYLGDARRDMESARAAGMVSVLASWGYLDGDEVTNWPVDLRLERADELLSHLA